VTQRRNHTFAMHTFFASRFALHRQHEANLGGRHDDLAISWEILASWAFVLHAHVGNCEPVGRSEESLRDLFVAACLRNHHVLAANAVRRICLRW
jgi:hypothetical protein